MKKIFFTFYFLLFTLYLFAQVPTTLKVAVFAPVYIDSAFSGYEYKLGNSNLPKSMLPGLDFYNGMSMAIDSLQKENINAQVYFYDTKSTKESLPSVLLKPEMQDVSLIIAAFNSNNEIKPLADFALRKKILLISATFPNDGGVRANPYFVIISSTLRTHVQNIHKYIQQNYSTNNIIYLRRKGSVEDFIQSVFSQSNKATASIPLNYKTVELNDNFTAKDLLKNLDSTKKNTIICGSISEPFALQTARTLSSVSAHYKATLIGMPTWDALKELDKNDCKNIDIVYSSAYNFQHSDKIVKQFVSNYKKKYAASPNDWAMKGFETTYRFTKLVIQYGDLATQSVSDNKYKVFNDFDIKPVVTNNNNQSTVLYLENRKSYFIKKNSGTVKSVN